jgi:DHA1 family inner membrane transport protein
VIYVLTAGTFLMGTSEFLVAGLLPQIARDYHVGIAQAGLSITVFAVGMIIGAPTIVLLTLRLSRRATLTLSLLIFAAGHVVVALSTSFALMLGARFVTALATSAFWGVASIVAAHAAGPRASSRALGIVLGGGMLANVAGVPLGSFFGQLAGWRLPFWLVAGAAIIAAIAVMRLVPGNPPEHQPPTIRTELPALRSGRLWLTLAICACVTGGVLSVYSYIAPLITDRAGLPESVVPVALVLFGVTAMIGTLIAGRLGDHHPYVTIVVASVVTLATVILLGVFSSLPIPMLVLFALLGLTGLTTNPILVSLAVHYGRSGPTLAGALTPSSFNLGTALGTGITAGALDSMGTLTPIVVGAVGAGLVAIGCVSLAIVARRAARESTGRAANEAH